MPIAHVFPTQRRELGPTGSRHGGQPEGKPGRLIDRGGSSHHGLHLAKRHDASDERTWDKAERAGRRLDQAGLSALLERLDAELATDM